MVGPSTPEPPDRHDRVSTVVVCQVAVERWHERIGSPAIAGDARMLSCDTTAPRAAGTVSTSRRLEPKRRWSRTACWITPAGKQEPWWGGGDVVTPGTIVPGTLPAMARPGPPT